MTGVVVSLAILVLFVAVMTAVCRDLWQQVRNEDAPVKFSGRLSGPIADGRRSDGVRTPLAGTQQGCAFRSRPPL